MSRRTLWFLSAVLPLVTACVATQHAPSPFAAAGPVEAVVADIPVAVANEHWLPMRVWAQWPGMRRFLGDVDAGTGTVFLIPGDLVRTRGAFRLYADPTGSADDVLSGPVDASRCRRVEWRLRKVLANSRLRVM